MGEFNYLPLNLQAKGGRAHNTEGSVHAILSAALGSNHNLPKYVKIYIWMVGELVRQADNT